MRNWKIPQERFFLSTSLPVKPGCSCFRARRLVQEWGYLHSQYVNISFNWFGFHCGSQRCPQLCPDTSNVLSSLGIHLQSLLKDKNGNLLAIRVIRLWVSNSSTLSQSSFSRPHFTPTPKIIRYCRC